MNLNEYMENFLFCLKRTLLFSVSNIENEDAAILFTVPTIESVKKNNYLYDYISLYHYNLSFCETSEKNVEIICHLHTRKLSMDACLFIVDLINENVYIEWHDCQITESTPWYTNYIYEHLEILQQILTTALQTKEELLDFYDDELSDSYYDEDEDDELFSYD